MSLVNSHALNVSAPIMNAPVPVDVTNHRVDVIFRNSSKYRSRLQDFVHKTDFSKTNLSKGSLT